MTGLDRIVALIIGAGKTRDVGRAAALKLAGLAEHPQPVARNRRIGRTQPDGVLRPEPKRLNQQR